MKMAARAKRVLYETAWWCNGLVFLLGLSTWAFEIDSGRECWLVVTVTGFCVLTRGMSVFSLFSYIPSVLMATVRRAVFPSEQRWSRADIISESYCCVHSRHDLWEDEDVEVSF